MMTIHIKVYWPEWLEELSAEEFYNVLKVARSKAVNAFEKELDKSEEYWKLRKAAVSEGQTDIYDYV